MKLFHELRLQDREVSTLRVALMLAVASYKESSTSLRVLPAARAVIDAEIEACEKLISKLLQSRHES